MIRSMVVVAGSMFFLVAAAACAQQPARPQTETKLGTLKEIEVKGRSRTLIVTGEDGSDQEYPLTPRVDFEVVGSGDAAFVAAGQYVEGKGVLSNEKLFVPEVTVYLLAPGKRPPTGRIVKVPPMPGESMNAFMFGGVVVSREPDAMYAEYERLNLRIAGRVPPIFLEREFQVRVISQNPAHAQPGMPVELELQPLRGGRYTLLRATVRASEPFKSEELLKPKAEDD